MSAMKISVYVAISVDGYIAKPDGNIDWLMEDVSKEDVMNDCGYKIFLDSVDVLVFGGKTYRQVLTFGDWPYRGKKCIIVSRTEKETDLPDVSFTTDSPGQIIRRLKLEGYRHLWVMGGGEIHSMFLNAGMIDEMRIFVMPKILGEGIPIFSPPLNNSAVATSWVLTGQKEWQSNIVELHYRKRSECDRP